MSHWWWAVLAGWLVLLALSWSAPRLRDVGHDDDLRFLNPEADSVRARALLEEAFPRDVFASTVVVVIESPTGLDGAEIDRVVKPLSGRLRRLARELGPDSGIHKITDYYQPVMGPKLLFSKDRCCTLVLVSLRGYWIATETLVVVRQIRKIMAEELAALNARRERENMPPLSVAVTGNAALGEDYVQAADRSIKSVHFWTFILVISILLLVYRSPFLVLIPLVTTFVSIGTSKALIALVAQIPWLDFKVINITEIFVTVLLFGAGTDYCLFVIARYREELHHGASRQRAIETAVSQVGGALAASAGTTMCGLGLMVAAEFAKLRYTGPAVALALGVMLLASLTLTPALLGLLGRLAFWPRFGQKPEQSWFWERAAGRLARRPGLILIVSLVVMAPVAVLGWHVRVSHDVMSELPTSAEVVRGVRMVTRHFRKGEVGPARLLIRTDRVNLTSARAKEALADLSRRLVDLPIVEDVRSLPYYLGVSESPLPSMVRAQKQSGFELPLFQNARRVVDGLMEHTIEEYYVASNPRPGSSQLKGRVTRLDLILTYHPFSQPAMASLEQIRRFLKKYFARPGHLLSGATFSFAGATALTNDIRRVTASDQTRISVLVVVGVYLILVLLLRKWLISAWMIVTVLFSYYVTIGVTNMVFSAVYHDAMVDWKVTFFLFVLLVAVGEDYNIYLMTRVNEEEKRYGPIKGTRVAVARTGRIISSCGLIMAGAFGSMLFSDLTAIAQLGFALAFGILLDTFIVRPILVPAVILLRHHLAGHTESSSAPMPGSTPPSDSDDTSASEGG